MQASSESLFKIRHNPASDRPREEEHGTVSAHQEKIPDKEVTKLQAQAAKAVGHARELDRQLEVATMYKDAHFAATAMEIL